jgi:hypothetical protein
MVSHRVVCPVALFICLAAGAAAAQDTRVGVVSGLVDNLVSWKPALESEGWAGWSAGAFVDVRTPLPGLRVVAEGSFVRRGVDVFEDVDGAPVSNSGIRSDYLRVSVLGRTGFGWRMVGLYVMAGPMVEQLLDSKMDAGLRSLLDRESPTVVGVSAGAGVTLDLGRGRTVSAEARRTETLQSGYSGSFRSVRYGSAEYLVRIGVPLPGAGSRDD